MGKGILYLFRSFHGIIHEWYISKKKLMKFVFGISSFNKKLYFILGTPSHTNLGDSAIALAEYSFLIKCEINPKRIKEITTDEYKNYKNIIRLFIKKKDVLILHGGGNMGDQWLSEELLRRDILKTFEYNKCIIFPQTIYYSNSSEGKNQKLKSVKYYNRLNTLTIIAREKKSFADMKQLYPVTEILLTPDIVLSFNKNEFKFNKENRNGILICFRNDCEKAMDFNERQDIIDFLKKSNYACTETDMYANEPITKDIRWEKVNDKMKEFSSASLVVTDRLHGMIFSAITETPCIVFANYNHKVKGTYEWIEYLNYIHFVTSFDEMKKSFFELKRLTNCKFDNHLLIPYFEKIKEVLQ